MEYNPDLLCDTLRTELEELKQLTGCFPGSPREGKITAWKVGNVYHYRDYTIFDNTHHTLSKTKDMHQIQGLCQAEYNEKLSKTIKVRERLIAQMLPKIQETNLDLVLEKLHPGKRAMVSDCVMPDDVYAAAWSAQEYPQKEPPAKGFHTEQGELVRSKSELMIANKLLKSGIPYRYEAELRLPECTLHPDFTVLNPRTRRVYIWEHLGMVGDADYSANALSRLTLLQRRGYLPGINLILTVESARQPLDSRQIQKVIDAYLT